MNRDETVELFLKGREAWNAWAEGLLAERKAMEAAGTWKSHRSLWEREEGDNPETQAWLDKAFADFFRCLFLVREAEGTKETAGEIDKENADSIPPVKSIQLETYRIEFKGFLFPSDAWFISATFFGFARFESATFCGTVSFGIATFTGAVRFKNARFKRFANFELVNFMQFAGFGSCRFEAEAMFYAIRGESGFDMADTVFEAVPDFIQAHFEEAPRLDNLKVHGRWVARHPQPDRKAPESEWREHWHAARHLGGRARTWTVRAAKGGWRRVRAGNADIPARWRALKRLAIQGHDTERELEFHARELQSQRFETDWPLPLRPWSADAWVGALRFWSGLLYGLFSDFGRSIFRPLLLWWATIAVFAMYFLSGQPDVLERRRAAEPQGFATSVVAYVKLIPSLLRDPPPCYAGAPAKDGKPDPEKLTGLAAPVAASTNALAEAFRLAIRNGSIFLDGGDDSARRTYGCLYGIQSFGGSPAPFVPGFVTDAAGIQKMLSALYIFLFGLALRNMLKMK